MEVLGSFEHGSHNPRRNTSKSFFETFKGGDRAETCLRLISSLSPLTPVFIEGVDTNRRQSGYTKTRQTANFKRVKKI